MKIKNKPNNSIKLLLELCIVLTILCSVTLNARAFQCFVCDSKNDIECMEKLPYNSRLKPQECQNITGAKFCIKTTNLYAGEFGTKRFCSANDHGNYCRYIRQPTGDRDYRSCVLTCNRQNCNSAMAPSPSKLTLSMMILAALTCGSYLKFTYISQR